MLLRLKGVLTFFVNLSSSFTVSFSNDSSIYSPAGWDNEKKIAILYENMHSVKPDQYFTDVIARPIVRAARSTNRELEASLIIT